MLICPEERIVEKWSAESEKQKKVRAGLRDSRGWLRREEEAKLARPTKFLLPLALRGGVHLRAIRRVARSMCQNRP